MKNLQGKSTIHSDSVAVVSSQTLRRGIAVGSELTGNGRRAGYSESINFKFLLGEVLGAFFILLTSTYILAVPGALSSSGTLKGIMSRAIKRTIDIISALVGLVLTLPVWILLPIIIKFDSPGSVFYSQVRVGVNRRKKSRRYHQRTDSTERRDRERRRVDNHGRLFKMYKFRTMVQDAEKKSGPVWATKNDTRITRLGSFLRKTRIDEIPQFINILRGEMSLVGPRPERPSFVSDLSEKVENYTDRLEVRPGLTGLAQVENGYDSSVASVVDKVGFDLEYIQNWSLYRDIKIILKTVVVVITGRGAC